MTEQTERPDPEEDPFACSTCGHPLSSRERLTSENCDACRSVYMGVL